MVSVIHCLQIAYLRLDFIIVISRLKWHDCSIRRLTIAYYGRLDCLVLTHSQNRLLFLFESFGLL